jgi:hypothetical protein
MALNNSIILIIFHPVKPKESSIYSLRGKIPLTPNYFFFYIQPISKQLLIIQPFQDLNIMIQANLG